MVWNAAAAAVVVEVTAEVEYTVLVQYAAAEVGDTKVEIQVAVLAVVDVTVLLPSTHLKNIIKQR